MALIGGNLMVLCTTTNVEWEYCDFFFDTFCFPISWLAHYNVICSLVCSFSISRPLNELLDMIVRDRDVIATEFSLAVFPCQEISRLVEIQG